MNKNKKLLSVVWKKAFCKLAVSPSVFRWQDGVCTLRARQLSNFLSPGTKYCHVCKSDYRRGLDWWIGFIDHLYTPVATTSNYSALANLHTLQITTAPAKPFSSLLSSSAVSCKRLVIQWRFFSFPRSRRYCPANIPQLNSRAISCEPPLQTSTELPTLNSQLTTELVNLIAFKITPRCGPHRKHTSSIVACVFVFAGTCLPSRCSESAFLYSTVA
jgi:hypothetical protein